MPSQSDGEQWGVWEAEDGRRVVYSNAVLEEIRSAAVEGLLAAPHGGVEVGGVLFGDYEGGVVRVTAQRPLACEHALGPGFRLSGKDQSALAELLEQAAQQGLRPVGWYHSHTRSGLELSEEDRLIHHRYFSQDWQVALVVRPYRIDDTRACFFWAPGEGPTLPAAGQGEFRLIPRPARSRTLPQPGERQARPAPAPAATGPGPSGSPSQAPAARKPRSRIWPWLAPAVLLLDGGGLAVWSYFHGAAESLELRAAEAGGRVVIYWQPRVATLRQPRRGVLTITDGSNSARLELTPEQLAQGSITYRRASDSLQVRLRVERWVAAPLEEQVLFLGGPAPTRDQAAEAGYLPEVLREREELAAEVRRLRRELENQRARAARLEEVNRLLRQRLAVAAAPKR